MGTTGLRSLDASLVKTREWLKEVRDELDLDDEEQAFAALRSVLHAVRDKLTVEEAADLGAQLPLLMRGAFYDGWRPIDMPHAIRTEEDFLGRVERGLERNRSPKLHDPDRLVRGVLKVLDSRVTIGEIEHVKRAFPEKLRRFWPSGTA
jgi:uncharacterized protein (DUF2267 family)